MNKALIFNIQNYSLNDGPGIRTTIFLKGCPLKCWWCHNPEGIKLGTQFIIRTQRCMKCKKCLRACSDQALSVSKKEIIRDVSKCSTCISCADICPTKAIEVVGNWMSTEEIIDEILKDKIFYEESGGGVTFSGGEPLLQSEILKKWLKICKEKNIHTALDTSGYASWETIEEIVGLVDLFLFDIKLMDDSKHIKYTGVSNKQILKNLTSLVRIHSNINVRLPIIPSINDNRDNITQIGRYISGIGLKKVTLLPYHSIGSNKYKNLGLNYSLGKIQEPSSKVMEQIKVDLKSFNLDIEIGG